MAFLRRLFHDHDRLQPRLQPHRGPQQHHELLLLRGDPLHIPEPADGYAVTPSARHDPERPAEPDPPSRQEVDPEGEAREPKPQECDGARGEATPLARPGGGGHPIRGRVGIGRSRVAGIIPSRSRSSARSGRDTLASRCFSSTRTRICTTATRATASLTRARLPAFSRNGSPPGWCRRAFAP